MKTFKQAQLKIRLKERAEKRARFVKWGSNPFAESIFTPKGHWISDGKEYVCDSALVHLRLVGASQDVVKSIRHTGWFADHYQDALITGQVYRLPAKKGKTRYIAAYLESERGTIILFTELFDNERDAALRADDMASYAAEQSREFHAKDAAEQDILGLKEEISGIRIHCLELLREAKPLRKKAGAESVLCKELRKSVKRYLSDISKKRARIEALNDNFWLAVEGY